MELTIWEREYIRHHVQQLKGPVGLIRKAMKVLDIIELTDEEKEATGWYITPSGAGWKDKDYVADLELKDPELLPVVRQVLRQQIRQMTQRDAWDVTALSKIPDLADKFTVNFDQIVAEVEAEKVPEATEA